MSTFGYDAGTKHTGILAAALSFALESFREAWLPPRSFDRSLYPLTSDAAES